MSTTPVVVGKISGVYGVKGWVKIFSYTEPRDNIVNYSPWLIKQGSEWRSFKLLNGRPQAKTIVAQLEGITDRDQAHALIGCQVAIEDSQLKSLDEDDFYWRDLEGLEVLDESGKRLGVVSHLVETGANDVMVVKRDRAAEGKAKEILIPWLYHQVVKKVDTESGHILVDWDEDY